MLISHPCRFIYLKTRKTGGTSVEMYFEPYCVDLKCYSGEERRLAAESEFGVVGSRLGPADSRWYNHMPAEEIRERAGRQVWESYYKFCVIRNPFDKVISWFWHEAGEDGREKLRAADFTDVRRSFAAWTELKHFPVDRWIYTIAGKPAVDRFIRYERLADDLREVCTRLGVPWQPARLGRYKGGFRKRAERFEEYYTAETANRVAEVFAWEMEHFQYSLPVPG